MELINGNLVRKVIAYKTRENNNWIHVIEEEGLWIFKRKCDYWTYFAPFFHERYSLEEMIERLSDSCFYKDGKVYDYPTIDFIFDYNHSKSKRFSSDEEMLKYLEEFKQQFGKSFILV